MPDKRTHRGPAPEDAKLFAAKNIPTLQQATADMSLLLTKGYAPKSSLKLVCDRFSLTQRQRMAVMRCACSDEQLANRNAHKTCTSKLTDKPIMIDGYNILITVEAVLGGGPIFRGRDNCYRDLASLHGSYRKVTETIPAIELIAKTCQSLKISRAYWLFDSPVSNSGRLKTMLYEFAEEKNLPWQVELLLNPDTELIKTDMIVATSDSAVLDNCTKWTNLTGYMLKNLTGFGTQPAKIIDLSKSQ